MKIVQKFFFIFIVFLLGIAAAAFWSLNTIRVTLNDSFEQSSLSIASNVLERIDEGILDKIEVFQEYSKNSDFLDAVTKSNEDFAQRENLSEYIAAMDSEWVSVPKATITPFMEMLLNTHMSIELQEKIALHHKKEGYDIFSEVIVTNTYGVNIALTGKSSDYRQDDEEWWQQAKAKGLYIEDIEYDESADVYSLAFSLRIDDQNGMFQGVIKVGLSIEEVFSLLNRLASDPLLKKYQNYQYVLATKDGNIIYSSEGIRFSDGKQIPMDIGQDENDGAQIIQRMSAEGELYAVHVHSRGYGQYPGVDWVLIIEFHQDEIFATAIKIEKVVTLLLFLLLIVFVLVGIFVARNISSPLVKLRDAARNIGDGKLETPIDFESEDEIGELAASFEKMVVDLKNTTASRDELLTEMKNRKYVEGELRKNEESLANAQKIAKLGNWDWDIVKNELYWSNEVYRIFEQNPQCLDVNYEVLLEFVHPEDRWLVQKSVNDSLTKNAPYSIDHRIVLANKEEKIVHQEGNVTFDREGKAIHMSGMIQDVTATKKHQLRLTNNADILELLASGASLEEVLTKIVLTTEEEYGGLLCSILLLDNEGKHLLHGASPNLPEFYNQAINGVEIGEGQGSCGTAAYTGELVVVDDIQTDPLWKNFKDLAAKAGLASCWSQPITSSHGNLLGTFAQYYRIPRKPSREELETIVNAAHLAGIAIERRQTEMALEKERRFLQGIIENSPAVLVVKDVNGRLELVNRQWESVTGRKREDVIGKTAYDLYPLNVAEKITQNDLQVLESRELNGYEETLELPDGEMTFLSLKFPLFDEKGEVKGLCGISTDITERKRTEEALQNAKEGAEAANRAKSEFLASMSHEIRTPMNAIIGMADLLRNTTLTSEQKEYVEIYHSAGKTLLQLIDDILDISKIEAGQLELEYGPFDLQEFIEQACETFAINAHSKGLELVQFISSDITTHLQGDSNRLLQILFNLLSNAIKFTEKGEVILMVLKDGESAKTIKLNFLVTDTGIGISEEKQGLIFSNFTQADSSTTRKHGGTGLGLSIAKFLVEKMGGEIRIDSKPDKGSTFSFSIEFEKQKECEKKEELTAYVEAIKGKPILLVGADSTSRQCLEDILLSWDAYVILSDNRESMLTEIEDAQSASSPFEVIIIDRSIPNADGFELVKEVKNNPSVTATIISLLNSNKLNENLTELYALGIRRHLIKPVKRSVLLETLFSIFTEELDEIGAEQETPYKAIPELAEHENSLEILLVEDDRTNQKVASIMLEKMGHSISIANNGLEAVESFQNNTYDLIFMDVNMPEMDGIEATKEIRKMEQERGGHIPIVAMTALVFKEDKDRCMESGMDAYVSKPVRAASVSDVLEKFFPRDGGELEDAAELREKEKALRVDEEPVFDKDDLLERTGNDIDFIKELSAIIAEDLLTELPEIKGTIARKDGKGLKMAAHKLKGSLGNMGGKLSRNIALELEMMGVEENFDEANEAFERLEKETRAFQDALSDFLHDK